MHVLVCVCVRACARARACTKRVRNMSILMHVHLEVPNIPSCCHRILAAMLRWCTAATTTTSASDKRAKPASASLGGDQPACRRRRCCPAALCVGARAIEAIDKGGDGAASGAIAAHRAAAPFRCHSTPRYSTAEEEGVVEGVGGVLGEGAPAQQHGGGGSSTAAGAERARRPRRSGPCMVKGTAERGIRKEAA